MQKTKQPQVDRDAITRSAIALAHEAQCMTVGLTQLLAALGKGFDPARGSFWLASLDRKVVIAAAVAEKAEQLATAFAGLHLARSIHAQASGAEPGIV